MTLRLLMLAAACTCVLSAATGCNMPTHEQQAAANEIYLQQEGLAALQAGSAAPSLAGALDDAGQPVDLDALLAGSERGAVLFFFPALDVPNSLRNLRDLQKRSGKLAEQGIVAAGVVPADPARASEWASRNGLTLPLLADPRGDVARAWGCLGPAGSLPQRTTIGVKRDGSVAFFYRGSAPEQEIKRAFELNGK